jgi:hypothetical protein
VERCWFDPAVRLVSVVVRSVDKDVDTSKQAKEKLMGKGLLLWLIGIPIPIILLLWIFGYLH